MGARADGQAIAKQKHQRAKLLIKQGLTNTIIAQRLGLRVGVVRDLRKEVEQPAEQ